jgi:hypothetical protein
MQAFLTFALSSHCRHLRRPKHRPSGRSSFAAGFPPYFMMVAQDGSGALHSKTSSHRQPEHQPAP